MTIKMNTEKNKNQIKTDITRHHLSKKILEIALFVLLFSSSVVTSAKAAPITEANVRSLVNKERTSRGIVALRNDDRLKAAAFNKSMDMIDGDYFEHYAFGVTPWDFIAKENYNYLYAGENLAMDFDTAEGMVDAWMNSPAHKANILNEDYSDIGVGVVKGEYTDASGTHETVMVTEMFGREKPAIIRVIDTAVEFVRGLFR
jgi:uncharacterized protein YkwD